MKFFELIHKDKKTNARVGVLHTPSGDVETPVFMPVGTQATVKSLTPDDLQSLGAQIILNNTYHLYLRPGADLIQKLGGVHKFQSWDRPILTDSGGFQVFSLGLGKMTKLSKRLSRDQLAEELNIVVQEGDAESNPRVFAKIDEEGVTFRSHLDGALHRFTPEVSIKTQHQLGADIILAFDECTPYPATLEYAKASLERTHRWAKESLEIHNRTMKHESPHFAKASRGKGIRAQFLFGIVQGAVHPDLRKESAKFIGALDFDGFCVGGVSVGEPKPKMYEAVETSVPYLPEEKPRHLLGVGDIDDLFESVAAGMDMFDCVIPTRLARNATLFVGLDEASQKFRINILNFRFASDQRPIAKNCLCYTCQNFARAYLHHLYKAEELLAYRLGSIHNLYFIVNLVKEIRKSILEGSFSRLKTKWFSNKF